MNYANPMDARIQVGYTPVNAPKEKKNVKPLKVQREEDNEMVTGVFRFFEVPGGEMKFAFRKHKHDRVESYRMLDGMAYRVPLGVAKHLVNNGWYPVHAYARDENDQISQRIGQQVKRFTFESLEFHAIEEFNTAPAKKIITVENV